MFSKSSRKYKYVVKELSSSYFCNCSQHELLLRRIRQRTFHFLERYYMCTQELIRQSNQLLHYLHRNSCFRKNLSDWSEGNRLTVTPRYFSRPLVSEMLNPSSVLLPQASLSVILTKHSSLLI